MNYLNTVKYDDTKRIYTDSFGYIVEPLKSTRLSVRDNEEVEESKDNIVMLQGGQSGEGVSVSADFSKDANVDITIEPKGTGVVKASSDIVATSIKENQVRITSSDANLGIISTEGLDTNVWLDLRTKGNTGSVGVATNGDQSQYIYFPKGQANVRAGGISNTDLILVSQGGGTNVSLRSSTAIGYLNVHTDYPAGTGVSLEAQSNNASCNIHIVPKNGYVSIPAQIQSTFGYMLLTRSALAGNFAMNVGAATEIQLDLVVRNTFGNGYWISNKSFTNISGSAMKLIVSGRAMPSSYVVNDSGFFDTSFKIYDSNNALVYTAGRQNFHPTTSLGTFFSIAPTACIHLQPGEYFRWQVYVATTGFNIIGNGNTDTLELNICQVP